MGARVGGGSAGGMLQNTALYDDADARTTTSARGNTIVYATPADAYGDTVPAACAAPVGTYGDAAYAAADPARASMYDQGLLPGSAVHAFRDGVRREARKGSTYAGFEGVDEEV